LSRTTWLSQYQKGKTNLDFTEARDSELSCGCVALDCSVKLSFILYYTFSY